MHLDRYYDVSQSADIETYEARLVAMGQELGFGIINGALVIEHPTSREKNQYLSVGNTPEAYLEAYKDKDAIERDPVVKLFRKLSIPFTYDQKLYLESGAIDLWEEQAAFGYKTGLAVAFHLPGRRHYLLGADREQPLPTSGNELSRLMADLQFLAIHAQSAAMRLFAPEVIEEVPTFSAREVEIMKWTHAGKNNWETGKILSMSEDGVKYYWKTILEKFDVQSKHQAVLKALNIGIL